MECANRKSRLCDRDAIRNDDIEAVASDEEPASTPNLYDPKRARPHSYRGTAPDLRTLACVIDAWAGSGTAGRQSFLLERAEAILDAAVERCRAYV